jgi:two-component system, response regulator YesN
LKIMIADDEELIRLGLAKILSKAELPIELTGAYSNGMAAWAGLSKLQPGELDVLITDIKMPVMDGLKLIEKAKERMPGLYVIVLSGFNDFEYARQAMRYGVTEYFLKPLDKYELYQALAKLAHHKEEEAFPVEHSAGEQEGQGYAIAQVKHILEKEYNLPFDLERLAEKVEFSPSYVSKLFRQGTGITITDYLIGIRIDKAKQFLLDYPQLKNYEVSSMVGYSDPVYFNKLFKRIVGLTPREFKEHYK